MDQAQVLQHAESGELEAHFIKALESGSNDSLEETQWNLRALLQTLKDKTIHRSQNRLHSSASIIQSIRRVSLLAHTFAGLQSDMLIHKQNVIRAGEALFESQAGNTGSGTPRTSNVASCSRTEDIKEVTSGLHTAPMRIWLLLHIDRPFPTTAEKQSIVDETNRRAVGGEIALKTEQVSGPA